MTIAKGSNLVFTGNAANQQDVLAVPADGKAWVANSASSLGWEAKDCLTSGLALPTAYTTVSSPAFSTPRTPNATRPVWVLANIQIGITILQTSTVAAQVNTGSGYVEIGAVSIATLGTTVKNNLGFWVPANASYQLVSTGTGTNTIVYIRELVF